MKFTCTKTNFNNGINIALKAVPGKTTMPILECVVIEAKGDMVKLTTNDMQLGIETKIPAEIEQDGIILVNAKMISEIVRRLPDDDVNFEVDENNKIHDTYRIDYLRDHILAMEEAVRIDGVELWGYTSWGCMDLVSASTDEMHKRYGFVYVNYQDDFSGNGERIRKDSFYWYKKVISSQGRDLK